jgi:UDP-N-acetylglucosamine 2-epimerase (non-hydrolysing)
MMHPKKILCVVGTRPEAVKVAPVLLALRREPDVFEPILLATAQHRELLDQVLAGFSLNPDIDLDIMRPEQSLTDVTCRVLSMLGKELADRKPDVVLAQGDTTTVMAAALACFYARIPFAHVEAGLRTGDKWAPYPEEMNRCIASLVAAYHFAPTESAAANLAREGVDKSRIFVTGNTVIDALLMTLHMTKPPPRPIPGGAPFVLMTCHRREIFGDPIREVFGAVRDFAHAHPGLYFWYPVHPNPQVRGPATEILGSVPGIVLGDPLDYVSFCHAMNAATLVLTDSGGVQEEAPALGKPVLVLRDVTERPEGVEAGTCRLVGPHRDRIHAALDQLLGDPDAYRAMARARNPYGDGRAADRIASVLAGGPMNPPYPVSPADG